MPIYEYHCVACSHELEALQKVRDSPLRKCPECGKLTLRRLISAPVFRLKGGGWYETDFKGDSEKKRNLVETKGAESSESATPATDSAKSGDAATKSADSSGKDAKKPAEKPAASEIKKPAPNASSAKRTRS